MQSITERLSNKPDAVQQASTPQFRVQNDSHKRVRPICVRCCLYMYQVPCLSVQHTVHSRRRSHAACSHSARGRPDLMQDGITQLSHARVSRQGASHSTPRVYSSVMLTLVRFGADGTSSCSSRITMATEELYDCRPVMRRST